MSQEKCIQTMGRIGRNKLQQEYSIRFRANSLIHKLFHHEEEKPEVMNMNRLFNTHKVIWRDNKYVEIEDDVEDDGNINQDSDEDDEFAPYSREEE